jgi:hypothetical protein
VVKTPSYIPRFQRAIKRLIAEVSNSRQVAAAIDAAAAIDRVKGARSSNLFLQVASSALKSDLLIRLIRVLDYGKRTSSFWYLYRCQPSKLDSGVDIQKLQDFSCRLKKIRDRVFVHIDKDGVFNPALYYSDANITYPEIHDVIECLWTALNQLYTEQFGKPYLPVQSDFDVLKRDLNLLRSSTTPL